MTLSDLLFLASFLFIVSLCIGITVSALRRRHESTRRLRRILGLYVAAYSVLLISVALLRPRRVYAPGERRCFDDWCVTAVNVKQPDPAKDLRCEGVPNGRNWIATIEVYSAAKRIRQRASDARAELEDEQGATYRPCGPAVSSETGTARSLSGELGPSESFDVFLPFRLPADKKPVGVVVHHGDFPGAIIIGADQSFLHRPALQRF